MFSLHAIPLVPNTYFRHRAGVYLRGDSGSAFSGRPCSIAVELEAGNMNAKSGC